MRAAFEENITSGREIGAGLCIRVDGRTVVDLWGGTTGAGDDSGAMWGPDTLVNAFSVGKGVTAIVAATCVARGEISWLAPLGDVWPEFANNGKESVTLRDALGHRAGLPGIRRLLPDGTMLDWDAMCALLAAERPWWSLGAGHGYHVNTFGFIVGEAIRRATGSSIGRLVRDRLAEPLGADVHVGVPAARLGDVADLTWGPVTARDGEPPVGDDADILQHRAYANPSGLSGVGWVNTPRWRTAEMPSTNMHASARGVCRVFDSLIGHASPVPAEVLSEAVQEVSDGTDLVLGRRTRFAHGFQIPIPERGFGPHAEAFGHYGAGGSLGYCDPVARVGFGYVMNRMGQGWQNERNSSLVNALYSCL